MQLCKHGPSIQLAQSLWGKQVPTTRAYLIHYNKLPGKYGVQLEGSISESAHLYAVDGKNNKERIHQHPNIGDPHPLIDGGHLHGGVKIIKDVNGNEVKKVFFH